MDPEDLHVTKLQSGKIFMRCDYDLSQSVVAYEDKANKSLIPPSKPLLDALSKVHLAKKCKLLNEMEWLDGNGQVIIPDVFWGLQDIVVELSGGNRRLFRGGDGVSHQPSADATRRTRRGGAKHCAGLLVGPGGHLQKMASVVYHHYCEGNVIQSSDFSVEHSGSQTKTGWSGKQPLAEACRKIVQAYKEGRVGMQVAHFVQVPHNLKSKAPTFMLDCFGQTFVVQTLVAGWLRAQGDGLWKHMSELMGKGLGSATLKDSFKGAFRGPHWPCLMGYQRPYSATPALMLWHAQNKEAVVTFLKQKVVVDMLCWANSLLEMFFPAVAARYQACVAWHRKHSGIHAQFGNFFQLCINGIFAGQGCVHCKPHANHKNVVGICFLIVYKVPGLNFDHTRYTWLVIWEAGVIIELPPWVALLYPSSLFYHFNIDIDDLRVVVTFEEGVSPTKANSVDITNGSRDGRGSIVLFNQSSMFQASETGYSNLTEARAKGHPGVSNFVQTVNTSYPNMGASSTHTM